MTSVLPSTNRHAACGNASWLAALHGSDATSRARQEELRRFILGGLRRALRGRGVDDALLEDLTQEAMIRIAARLDSFRGDSAFTTWALAVAIRVAYTHLRRRRWGHRSLDDLEISKSAQSAAADRPPVEASVHRDVVDALRNAIDNDLTVKQRAAVLGELAGMPTTVLAEELDTNTNALYKLHHDARRKLRFGLEERGFSISEVRSMLQQSPS